MLRAEVSDLGHRSQGKPFVYPLPRLRDNPLYGRVVRRVDVETRSGSNPNGVFKVDSTWEKPLLELSSPTAPLQLGKPRRPRPVRASHVSPTVHRLERVEATGGGLWKATLAL